MFLLKLYVFNSGGLCGVRIIECDHYTQSSSDHYRMVLTKSAFIKNVFNCETITSHFKIFSIA